MAQSDPRLLRMQLNCDDGEKDGDCDDVYGVVAEQLDLPPVAQQHPPKLWKYRAEYFSLHSWQVPGAARPKYIKQFFGAAPIRLGVGKTRNPQDEIDTQWNYPNPLFEATRWYYNELEWEDPATNAEVKLAYPGAQIGTPWVLLAADFAMSTGLEIASKKTPTPSDLLQAANIFADMSRRAAHCCKCKPLPEGIIQQPAALAELSPYGLPSTRA